jgi:hypothetical protein
LQRRVLQRGVWQRRVLQRGVCWFETPHYDVSFGSRCGCDSVKRRRGAAPTLSQTPAP